MNQRSEEFHQKATTYGFIAGCACLLGGMGAVMFGISPLSSIIGLFGYFFIGVGVLLLAGATGYGFLISNTLQRGRPIAEANCRVMARYGVGQSNELIPSDRIEDEETFRPYVRLYSPTRGAIEYQCALPVWYQCGEGMLGEALVQGRWLSSFTPYVGAAPAAAPPHVGVP